MLRSLDMSKKTDKKNVFTVKLLCHVNLETNIWFSCKTLRLKIGIKNHLSFKKNTFKIIQSLFRSLQAYQLLIAMLACFLTVEHQKTVV